MLKVQFWPFSSDERRSRRFGIRTTWMPFILATVERATGGTTDKGQKVLELIEARPSADQAAESARVTSPSSRNRCCRS